MGSALEFASPLEFPSHIFFGFLAQKSIFFTVLRMPTSHFLFGCGLRWAIEVEDNVEDEDDDVDDVDEGVVESK